MKTTVNGKEIELFNQKSIEGIYTEIVKKYLDVGYNFYFYSGSQGEEVKTCLTKDGGKTVYIIFVDKEYRHWDEIETIWVKRFNDVHPNQTLWLNKGETVYQKEFYCITDRRRNENKVYVGDGDDFELINTITHKRRHARYDSETEKERYELSEKAKKVALKYIRKQKGYKSIHLKDVVSVVHRIGYGYEFKFENSSKNFSVKTAK